MSETLENRSKRSGIFFDAFWYSPSQSWYSFSTRSSSDSENILLDMISLLISPNPNDRHRDRYHCQISTKRSDEGFAQHLLSSCYQ